MHLKVPIPRKYRDRIKQGESKRPRRLTPRECARLMGFPDSFKTRVSDTPAYQQFSQTVLVPIITEVAKIMTAHILTQVSANSKQESNGN